MIPPITREEKYIYEIVGAGETAPEKPLTRKELFYAVILGEDRTVPRPITNAEKYLAALAGAYSETLPFPTTRIEKFLAKAAGMDVETPVPVTREEIFWDNYSAVQKFEGILPIVFTSKGKVLKNYRIYGNTVEGESVGDLVTEGEHAGQYRVPVTVEGKNLFNFDAWVGTIQQFYPKGYYSIVGEHEIGLSATQDNSFTLPYRVADNGYRIFVLPNSAYTLSWISDSDNSGTNYVFENGVVESGMMHKGNNRSTKTISFVTSATTSFVTLRFAVDDANTTIRYSSIQFERGLAATAYEPYSEPITTNLYLPEPIKMVEDEAEYVDFVEQKQYFADGSYADVNLPELPTIAGTNILSVDTQVHPSKVYVEVETKTGGYTVYFYNGETLLETITGVRSGGTATYTGAAPTKESTQQYNYNFIGWNTDSSASTADADALKNVTANRSVYAISEQVARGYTVYFYNGDTLLQTVENVPEGGTATYTGETPSKQGYIFTGWSPSNTNITVDTSCYAQFEVDELHETISDTWQEIINNINNGTYTSKYSVGDTKLIDLGTEGKVIMQIVALDTDSLADNSGTAPITWVSKQLLKTSHRMNPSYSSGKEGTGSLGGWEKTEMRSYLKDTIKPLIPETVRNAIKPVKKYTRIYNVSENSVSNVLTTDDVWIPSHQEVFGNFRYESSGVYYSSAFPNNASRIKSKVGSSAVWWWFRSANGNNYFDYVNAGGSYSSGYAYAVGGVALGFCT